MSTTHPTESAKVYPSGLLNTLTREEVAHLHDASTGNLSGLLRRCALAILNSGGISDDAEALLRDYCNFRIDVEQVNRGLRLNIQHAPASAFVNGRIIEGVRERQHRNVVGHLGETVRCRGPDLV